MDMLATAMGPKLGSGPAVRPAAKGAADGQDAAASEGAAGAFAALVPRDSATAPEERAEAEPVKAEADAGSEDAAKGEATATVPPALTAAAPPLAPSMVLDLASPAGTPSLEDGGATALETLEPAAPNSVLPEAAKGVAAKVEAGFAAQPGTAGAAAEQPAPLAAEAPIDGPRDIAPSETAAPSLPTAETEAASLTAAQPETAPAPKEVVKAQTGPDSSKAAEVPAGLASDGASPDQNDGGREGGRQERSPDEAGRVDANTKADRPNPAAAGAAKAEPPPATGSGPAMAAAAADAASAADATASTARLDAAAPLEPGTASAPTAGAPAHAAAARVAPHLQVGQQIVRRFDGGSMSIDLRLDPPELGQVSVKLDVGADGTVKAAIGADTPAALAELVRGARELERALSQAGLSVDRGALTFDLHDRSGGGPGQQDRNDRSGANAGTFAEAAATPAPALTASLWRAARVDLIA